MKMFNCLIYLDGRKAGFLMSLSYLPLLLLSPPADLVARLQVLSRVRWGKWLYHSPGSRMKTTPTSQIGQLRRDQSRKAVRGIAQPMRERKERREKTEDHTSFRGTSHTQSSAIPRNAFLIPRA